MTTKNNKQELRKRHEETDKMTEERSREKKWAPADYTNKVIERRIKGIYT